MGLQTNYTINYPACVGNIGDVETKSRKNGGNFYSAKFQLVDSTGEIHYCEVTASTDEAAGTLLANLFAKGDNILAGDLPPYVINRWGDNGQFTTLQFRAAGVSARPVTFNVADWLARGRASRSHTEESA